MRAIPRVGAVALAFSCAAPVALGQAVGAEFQVNTYTTSDQESADVAPGPSGTFVVVWKSNGGDVDTDMEGIRGRLFDASGPLGADFQVNTVTTGRQRIPAVATDASGNFVVAWESDAGDLDTSGRGIRARRFNAAGSPLGADFQVNSITTGKQVRVDVASDPAGNFVVTWASATNAADSYGYGILARRFDSSGAAIGGDFQVNSLTTGDQYSPSVATDAAGNFVVAWVGSSGDADTDSYSVRAHRFAASGAPIGGDFEVNTYTTGAQGFPAVASAADGSFVVAWISGGGDIDTSGYGIRARRFDSSANPIGSDFQVNTLTTGNQYGFALSIDTSGGFLVAWDSDNGDGNLRGIRARRFDASGNPVGDDFQVNTYTTSEQYAEAVAATGAGEYVVVWDNAAQVDGSSFGVFGQRLQFSTTPTLAVDDVVVSESAGTATFTVSLSFASTNTVTVKYKTANGTALSGASKDYMAKALTTLTFAPGQTSKPVSITINQDALDEDDEFFFVNLSVPTNATLADSQGLGTIQDDDNDSSLSIGDASVTEGDSGTQMMTFTVTLSPVSGKDVSLTAATANDSATAPSDFTAKTSALTINAGMTSKTFTVTIKGDTADEPNESFFVNLSGETNAAIGDGQGVGTILNNDSLAGAPSLSVTDATVTEGEAGTTDATFTVSLSATPSQTVTVHYATANGTAMAGASKDFLSKSGTLTFPAGGGTSQNVTVKVNGDSLNEADETLFFNLSSPVQATIADGQGLGTIQDNDPLPSLSIEDVGLNEGDSGTQSMAFTVTLSAASGQKVTVHYATGGGNASAPSDYTAKSGTLTFNAGQTSKTISVTIKGDTLFEGVESFLVTLDSPTNATFGDNLAVGTISDDD